jgi:tight adherence protein B
LLVSVLSFCAVTFGLLGLFVVLGPVVRPYRTRVRQRCAHEFRTDLPAPAPTPLYRDLESLDFSMPAGPAVPARSGVRPDLRRLLPDQRKRLAGLLEQADLRVSIGNFLAVAAALGAVAGAACFFWAGWKLAVVAGPSAAALPFFAASWKRKARRDKFLSQLPGAFELMARVLRAGQSVTQAFQAAADAAEEPLGAEFSRCTHQQNLGLRPEVVLQEMAGRSGIVELRIFVMAVAIQRQTGGNLSEVLDRLATLVRSRLQLRQEVRTLTAEGRLQGLTLAVLPVLMFGVLFVLNRKYAEVLLEHPGLLAATGACMAFGILWIRRIVNSQD